MPRRPRAAARVLALASCAAALLTPAAAWAHPHVWITVQSQLRFEHGMLSAVFMRWGFDPMFSDYIRNEVDKNHDRKFDQAETRALIDGAFTNLRQYGFLTHLSAGGRPVELEDFRDFGAHMDKDALVYEFVLPLPRPLDPRQPIKLSVYDETYYIDVEFSAKNPVTFAGDGPPCTSKVAEDETTTIYFGMVNPLAASITCHTS